MDASWLHGVNFETHRLAISYKMYKKLADAQCVFRFFFVKTETRQYARPLLFFFVTRTDSTVDKDSKQ